MLRDKLFALAQSAGDFHYPEYAEAGGLMGYGTTRQDLRKRSIGEVTHVPFG